MDVFLGYHSCFSRREVEDVWRCLAMFGDIAFRQDVMRLIRC